MKRITNFNLQRASVLVLLLLGFSSFICAQTSVKSIQGIVIDETGEPLPGVSILEKGTQKGTITSIDGTYNISVDENAVLLFSFVGFETQELVVGSQTTIDVQLEPFNSRLQEVVVTAYGITKSKRSVGYAQTEVKGQDLTQAKDVSVASLLYGKASGTAILKPATGANGSTKISIRGIDGFSGDRQPLIVVDGVPIDNTTLGEAGEFGGVDRGDAFSSINPDDIESINILKGAAAGTLYGERGANGVVIITTKKGQKELQIEYNSTFMSDQPAFFQDFFQNQYGQGRRGENSPASNVLSQWASWGGPLDGSDFQYYDGVLPKRLYTYK